MRFSLSNLLALGSRKSNRPANDPVTKENLGSLLTQNLSDVINACFPRTVDAEHGGFLCEFDCHWQPNGSHQKRLEFQARQTRAAAQAAIFDPGYRQARAAAEHGFRYLTDRMWDREHGGWFYMLHRNGEPVYAEKHVHGMAYAIQACVEHHHLTGATEGLEAAQAAFDWLEAYAHDSVNGGYYPYLKRDGTPIIVPSANGNPRDPIGTPIGLKDCNTTMDLLDALVDLLRATGSARVGRKVNELLSIVRDSMFQPPGIMFKHYTPDWMPAGNAIEIGVVLQASCTLNKAMKLMPDELRNDMFDIARAMVDACLRGVWDENEAVFRYEGAVDAGSLTVQDAKKYWWVQAEGMRALRSRRSPIPRTPMNISTSASVFGPSSMRTWSIMSTRAGIEPPRCRRLRNHMSGKMHRMKRAPSSTVSGCSKGIDCRSFVRRKHEYPREMRHAGALQGGLRCA